MQLYHALTGAVGVAGARQRRVAAALGPLMLGACVSVQQPLPDGSTRTLRGDAIAAYAGDVFLRQNQLSSMLMAMMVELDHSPALEPLEQAMLSMEQQCAPLNRLAVAMRDGTSATLSVKREFAAALGGCDTASLRLQQLLDKMPEGGY